jgi:hypothetical protein
MANHYSIGINDRRECYGSAVTCTIDLHCDYSNCVRGICGAQLEVGPLKGALLSGLVLYICTVFKYSSLFINGLMLFSIPLTASVNRSMSGKRLLEQVRDRIRAKHYSLRTEEAYTH